MMEAVTLTNDFRFCRDVTRQAASNFYAAFRLLPKERREALCVVYALCRAFDDAVDETPPDEAARLVDDWREEVRRAYQGTATHPATRALEACLEHFPIPRAALLDVLDGVEMDLHRSRYRTWQELEVYCRRVASAVGLASIEIFGYESSRTRDYAVRLGIALQLTNILRDLSEDAARGRVYLPEEDLERFGYDPEGLRFGVYNRRFRELMAFECDRARSTFESAEEVLDPIDRPRLAAAEAMRMTYQEVLDRIVAEDFHVFERRIRLPGGRKLVLAASFWLRSWIPS